MNGPSITLKELESLPSGTRLETVKDQLRTKQTSDQLARETALKLELAK